MLLQSDNVTTTFDAGDEGRKVMSTHVARLVAVLVGLVCVVPGKQAHHKGQDLQQASGKWQAAMARL